MTKARSPEPYSVEYYVAKYRRIRHRAAELFESERYFLPRCLRPGMRVLDVGCACGGFYGILHELEPSIDYCGVDIAAPMLEEARRLYPAGRFELVDGIAMPYPAGHFDLVQSWGVLLHEPEYRALLGEAWRVCAELLLFDVRLRAQGTEIVDQDVSFILNPGGVRNYYIVLNAVDFVRDLLSLDPRPAAIEMFGYEGQANRFATLPDGTKPLYMVAVGVHRGAAAGTQPTRIALRLPPPLLDEIRHGLEGDARASLVATDDSTRPVGPGADAGEEQ